MNPNLVALGDRNYLLLALGVALLVCFTGVWNHSLWNPDEPRVAAIGAEMAETGDLLVPGLGGRPFLEKPPLAWWAMAASIKVFGRSAGAARLPGAVACFCALLLVYDTTRLLADARAGLFSVLVLSSTWGFLYYGHRCVVDAWLLLFMTLGLACFTRAQQARDGQEARGALWIVGIYTAGGLAFLAKGPIGPVLLGTPLLVLLLYGRRWSFFRSPAHLIGLAALLALCVVWPLMLYARGGWSLLDGFLVDNVLYRVLEPPLGHSAAVGGHVGKGFHYYLLKAPVFLLPWTLAAPLLVHWLVKNRLPTGWNGSALAGLACVFPLGVLLLSLPSTKRTLYLLPLVPCTAPLVGSWLSALTKSDRELERAPGLLLLLLASGGAILTLGLMVGSLVLGSSWGETIPVWWIPLRDELGPPLLTALAVLALASAALACQAARLYRARSKALIPLVLSGALGMALVYNVVTYRVLEPVKGTIHLAQGLEERGAFAHGLVALWLDEGGLGAVSFYTGRTIPHLYSFDDVEVTAFVEGNAGGTLLIREGFVPRLSSDVTSRLQLQGSWRLSRKNSYVLYTIQGP